jgi:hypothetical protein
MDTPQATGPEYAPKLTNWSHEPTIQILKQDLESATPSHNAQMLDIQRWSDLLNVKGSAKIAKIKGRSSVQPKLIRRQAEWRYPGLSEPFLGSSKLFKVSPVTWEDDAGAKQNELVLNWQWRTKLNKVKFIDDYVRATVDEGTSIIQLGWDRVTVLVKQQAPVWSYYPLEDPQQVELLQQALQLKEEDPHGFDSQVTPELREAVKYFEETGEPVFAQQTGTQMVEVEKVLTNKPTVTVLDPNNVYIDPTCQGDINKALFVVVSFETNKASLLKQGKRYKNLNQVNWESNTPMTDANHATNTPTDFNFQDVLRKKVVAYEYWGFYDIHGDGKMVAFVATWIGNTMIRMEINPFPDEKLPFVVVPYLPKKRDLYGEPDAELLEENQKILGAVTRGMVDLLGRSANGQQGFAKGLFDALNRKRYEDGKDYEFNPSITPQNGVIEHKFPELPNSGLTMLALQNQEAEALTGVKSFSGGLTGQAYGDVAAGVKGMLGAAGQREMSILRRLAMGMIEIGQKIITMNSAFLSEQEVVRVTNAQYIQLSPNQQATAKIAGDQSDDRFVTVNREDLVGNFDLEVDISTAEVDNQKAQDMAFMLQTIGPSSDPEISMMIMAEIAELKRMPALAHKLRTFKPQPDPMAEQMKQLQLENAQLENAKLKSEISLNEAKAQEVISKKDKADLEYVEQETGTKHAREMEKQAGQAQGNQQLEVTKALTKPRKEGESSPNLAAAIGFNEISSRLR